MLFEQAQREFRRLKRLGHDPLIVRYGVGPGKRGDFDFDVVARSIGIGKTTQQIFESVLQAEKPCTSE